jgi:DNA-binding NarL/FixJ family response regulator
MYNMSDNHNIRLLIAESNATLREALVIFLSAHEDIKIVALVDDDDQVRALVHQHKPDILLIDPLIQPKNPLEYLQTLCQESNGTSIIVLSSPFNGVTKEAVIQAGAAKYVEKGIFASDLVGDIREVFNHR